MSYLTNGRRLKGRYYIKNHAVTRMRERYGDRYIGNKKIKNMSTRRLKRKLRECLKNDIRCVREKKNNDLLVITGEFNMVVVPKYHNYVVTVIPK